MIARKVTAIEEKVLALAVEWAEKREASTARADSAAYRANPCDKAANRVFVDAQKAYERLRDASVCLLRQRRAKGAG